MLELISNRKLNNRLLFFGLKIVSLRLLRLRILIEVGTRPEIINTSSLIRAIQRSKHSLIYLHTGQHYDFELSKQFIQDLQLPKPQYEFDFKSKSHAEQTGQILIFVENALLESKPDLVVVQGDTNSTLATALAAVKLQIPVAHIEAGNRSYDRQRPEEINRVIIDHISQVLFAQSRVTETNLIREGIAQEQIFVVGHPVVDACLQNLKLASSRRTLESLKIECPYVVVTAHRAENVDDQNRMNILLNLLAYGNSKGYTMVFPVHPRTRKRLKEFGLLSKIEEISRLIPPQGYLDFLQLLNNCEMVITDSGGIQKEVATLRKPCLYFHNSTGAWEGLNTFLFLGGYQIDKLKVLMDRLLEDSDLRNKIQVTPNPYGDGSTGQQILTQLEKLYKEGNLRSRTFQTLTAFETLLEEKKNTG